MVVKDPLAAKELGKLPVGAVAELTKVMDFNPEIADQFEVSLSLEASDDEAEQVEESAHSSISEHSSNPAPNLRQMISSNNSTVINKVAFKPSIFGETKESAENWTDKQLYFFKLSNITDDKTVLGHLFQGLQPNLQSRLRDLLLVSKPTGDVLPADFKEALKKITTRQRRSLKMSWRSCSLVFKKINP